MAARHGHRLGPRDPRSRLCGRPAPRSHPVTLLVTETTGALSPTFDRALRALGKHAHARRPPMTPPAHPVSRYGLSRSSHRTFLAHHRAAISAAVVLSQSTVSQSVSYFTVPPRAHPSTGSQSGSATAPPLPRRSRGRDYHISRRTRHELQAHHRHVALLNRPRAGPALVCEVLV